jgi:predicted RNA-binding Zn ribbon-like protein
MTCMGSALWSSMAAAALPIPATFAEKVVRRGNDHRPYDEEQENDDVFHGRMTLGSIGVHVRFQPLWRHKKNPKTTYALGGY